MLLKRFTIHIVFLVFLVFGSKAQSEHTPYHFVLGKKELANTDVYSIYYDQETEIIFIGTNNGVFQYSQSKFHKIPTPKNAIGNSFFSFQKNKKGQLFCSNVNGQIFKVEPNKIELYYSVPTKDVQSKRFDYQFDKKGRLWCYSSKLWLVIEKQGVIETKVIAENIHLPYYIQFYPENRLSIFIYAHNLKKEPPKILDDTFSIEWQKTTKSGFNRIFEEGRIINDAHDGNYDVVYGKPQQKIQITLPFNSAHNALEPINDSMFLITGVKQGMAIGTIKSNNVQFSKILFQNRFISTVFLSDNKMLLLGTFKNGIIVVPNIDFQGVSSNSLYTDIAFHDAENIIASTYNGSVYAYHLPTQKEEKIMSYAINVDNLFITSSPTNNAKKLPYLYGNDGYFRDAVELKKGLYAIAKPDRLQIVFSEKKAIENTAFVLEDFLIYRFPRFIYNSIYHTSNKLEVDTVKQLLYFSTSNGLFKSPYAKGADFKQKIKISDEFINDIHFSDGKLFCATNNGVFIFQDDKIIQHIDIKDGFFSNKINKLKYKNNLLFVLTSQGMQVYDLQQKRMIKLGLEASLLGSDLVDFDVSNSHFAILRKSDYFILPLNSFYRPVEVANSYLDSILVNEKPISLDKTSFSYSENSFSFFVDYRDIKTKFHSKIEYQLSGLSDDWKPLSSENHRIEFLSLPVGEYTFSVRTAYQSSYSPVSTYAFTIHPPYWQKWWFYVLISVLSAGVIGSIAWYRLKNVKRKAVQKLEVEYNRRIAVNAQLKAIRAQMNPHFIFNSINSIQDLILQQETLKSYDYLSSFSRLVRMTLDHSEREFVSLEEEIDFLNLYLELETLRFDDSFSFQLKQPKEFYNYTIPSIIVQPFVENAIKHGLLHKFGRKKLTISFKKTNEKQIVCTVEDNGVGREEALKIMQRRGGNHSSFSTNAIKKRMKMLEEQLDAECKYKVIDLKKEDGSALGTRVEIYLPIIKRPLKR